ncbi:MAG: hypothetical protein RIR25_722, partial [Verrucomicrobiota bacterium]
KGDESGGGADEERPRRTAKAAAPTVKPAADAEGSVTKKPNLFQRLFGKKKKSQTEG